MNTLAVTIEDSPEAAPKQDPEAAPRQDSGAVLTKGQGPAPIHDPRSAPTPAKGPPPREDAAAADADEDADEDAGEGTDEGTIDARRGMTHSLSAAFHQPGSLGSSLMTGTPDTRSRPVALWRSA